MKIIDTIGEIPTAAGEAEIIRVTSKDTGSMMERREKQLLINVEGKEPRFYQLKEGQQFLYAVTSPSTRNGSPRQLFFGGMDESPFLVELRMTALEGLLNGEEGFYEGLKTPTVRSWEAALKVSAKRQGDFFAVGGKKFRWPDLFKRSGTSEFTVKSVVGHPLVGTRHRFSGILAQTAGGTLIGEGTIEAPDHEPLTFEGPHMIDQAIHFVRPQEAD